MNLFILGGPLNSSSLAGVNLPPDTQTLIVSGDGSSYFSGLASQYQGPDGRILPGLLAANGLSRDQFDKVVIAGFSAWHGLANPMLLSDGNLIDGAIALDSCFGLAGQPEKAGYVSYAARAAGGSRLFVLTASGGQNGPGLPPSTTGIECALYNAQTGAAQAGRSLSAADLPAELAGAPAVMSKAGNLYLIDFSGDYPHTLHGDLINTWGVGTMNAFAVPLLNGSMSLGVGVAPLVAGVLGLAVGVAIGRMLT